MGLLENSNGPTTIPNMLEPFSLSNNALELMGIVDLS